MKSSTLPAVTGTVRLIQAIGTVGPVANATGEIEITSQTKRGPVARKYFVQVHQYGYRLVGWDDKRKESTVYDLPGTIDTCDCRDFTSRADKREDALCKHCKAIRGLVAKGKLPAVECKTVHQDAEADALAGEWADAEAEAWHAQYDAA